MRMILLIALLGTAMTTAACSRAKPFIYDGIAYKGKTTAPRSDRKSFTATVRPVSAQTLPGALAAGRYEGVKHCVRYYGVSDIAWTLGPDSPSGQLLLAGNTLTLRGTCVE